MEAKMAGRIGPPPGSRPSKKRRGANQTSLRAFQKSSGEWWTDSTGLRNTLGSLGTLFVLGRGLAHDLAHPRLEGELARVFRWEVRVYVARLDEDPAAAGEASGEGNVPGPDVGLERADDQILQGDVACPHLQLRLAGLGVDVADGDVSLRGLDPHVAADVAHRHITGLGHNLHAAGEAGYLDFTRLGLDLDGAAGRYSEQVVRPGVPAPVGLEDEGRVFAGEVHRNPGGFFLGGGGIRTHRVPGHLVLDGFEPLHALYPHLPSTVGEADTRLRAGVYGVPGHAGAGEVVAQRPPQDNGRHRQKRQQQDGEEQERRGEAGGTAMPPSSPRRIAGPLFWIGAARLLFAPDGHGPARPYTSSRRTMSSSSNSPKEISSILTSSSPTDESLCTVSLGMKSFSSGSGWRTSPSSSTAAPGSRTTQSSSRLWWYWRESMPPGATVMILTVQGRLWVYCSNLPQGFSSFNAQGMRWIIGSFLPGTRGVGVVGSASET